MFNRNAEHRVIVNNFFQIQYISGSLNKMFSKSNTSESDEETYIKEEGNRLFYIKQYEKAVECYDLAIVSRSKCPPIKQSDRNLRYNLICSFVTSR